MNFLLVEDEELIRDGIKALLTKETFTSSVFVASSKAELKDLDVDRIDVALIDFKLADSNGLEVMRYLKTISGCKFIIVTGLEGPELIVNLLKEGAHSIIYKLDGYKEIKCAIARVKDSGIYIPPRIMKVIEQNAHRWENPPPILLTFLERELIAYISSGLTTKEMAKSLKMTEATTETYRLRLLKKLGVPNTAAMMAYAFRNGIL